MLREYILLVCCPIGFLIEVRRMPLIRLFFSISYIVIEISLKQGGMSMCNRCGNMNAVYENEECEWNGCYNRNVRELVCAAERFVREENREHRRCEQRCECMHHRCMRNCRRNCF